MHDPHRIGKAAYSAKISWIRCRIASCCFPAPCPGVKPHVVGERAGRRSTTMRSPTCSASLIEWVMNTAVLPFSPHKIDELVAQALGGDLIECGERLVAQQDVGASVAKARAIETRWRMPPDSACG